MTDKPETQSEVSPRDASYWLGEIAAAQLRLDAWYKKAEKAQERYDACDDNAEIPVSGLNIFWSNVETQRAAIGEDFGSPEVTRVNMPEDDGGLARHVALVWQRSITAAVRDTNDNHDISLAVDDVFIPGRGQIWLEVDKSERGWVSAALVRVVYRDYLEGSATRWGSVPWVARRHMFTKDELATECGLSEDEIAKVPLNVTLPHSDSDKPEGSAGQEQFKRAEVFEIWTKYPKKARLYVAVGFKDKVLNYEPDPLKLKDFFPCPRPMLANGDESRPPLTDYSRYQVQAEELDIICDRITVLTGALQRKGVHDSAFKELADLSEIEENKTVAVENWAGLQQAGGLSKVVEWQDILPIAQVLVELYKQRDTLINLIYQLSGISDLARGHTDPDETATAQQLKQTFGSSRFRRREKDSRRFAAEGYQIKGEVIAELFPREQLQEMSGIPLPLQKEIDEARKQLQQIMGIQQQAEQARQQLAQLQQAQNQPGFVAPAPQALARLQALAQTPPPNQEQIEHLSRIAQVKFSWEKVAAVLQSDYRRCYSVVIETDQSAFVDQEADKAARSQFFANAMSAMQQVAPLIAGNPKNGEVFKRFVMFNLAGFKAGRSMEEGIEQALDAAIQAAQQSQGQQQPSPDAIKLQIAQVGLQTAQVKLQTEQQRAQNAAAKSQAEAAQGQQKAAQEVQKTQAQHDQNQAKRTGQQIDNLGKVEKLEFERATRATAQEALLYGPTQAPNGAA